MLSVVLNFVIEKKRFVGGSISSDYFCGIALKNILLRCLLVVHGP